MEDAIGNLLYATQYPRPIGALRTIKEISRSIIEINGSFVLSKVPTVGTIINLYSEEEDLTAKVRLSAPLTRPKEKALFSTL
tara:strand:+ start:930 stop:1175 length:246 start_codon:yes stop_codon:yes gene_type:complete